MRKAFLKKVKASLADMRAQTLRSVQQEMSEGREQSKDDGMDTYDLASESRDREIDAILTDRERSKLLAIDEALERIEDGSYGKCEECGADISEGRLSALPFTRLCVTCQSEQERESRLNRRFEDDRAFRRFGSGDLDDDSSS
jgi:DnaK suppressor protein